MPTKKRGLVLAYKRLYISPSVSTGRYSKMSCYLAKKVVILLNLWMNTVLTLQLSYVRILETGKGIVNSTKLPFFKRLAKQYWFYHVFLSLK